MLTGTATVPSGAELQHGRFCRGCGYNLGASSGRCPECGRAFDAGNPRTFLRGPRRGALRRLRPVALIVLATLVLAGGALLWLRHGWLNEQRRLADLRQHLGSRPSDLAVTAEPLSPWLRRRLPERVGVYLDRVTDIQAYSTATSDADLKSVASFTHLRGLMLQGPKITDAGLAELKGLTNLRELHLMCRRVTDSGVADLKEMRRMEELTIQGGKMTDRGLEHLHAMPQLRRLAICGNAVTPEGLLRWKRRHPDVQVLHGPDGPIEATEPSASP